MGSWGGWRDREQRGVAEWGLWLTGRELHRPARLRGKGGGQRGQREGADLFVVPADHCLIPVCG